MRETYASADDVMDRIAADEQQAIEAMERAQEYRRATQLVRCRGTRRGVVVEVNAHGVMTGVEFSGASRALGLWELAEAVKGAYATALEEVLDRLVAETKEAWGDSETTEAVVDELRERLTSHGVGPGGR